MLKKYHYFFVKDFNKIYYGNIAIPKLKASWDKHTILDYLLLIDHLLKNVYRLKERYSDFNKTTDYETCAIELEDLIHSFRNHQLEFFRAFGKTLIN